MVQASFAAVFLLKIAILFPAQVTAKYISQEVSDLANLMSECAAERYALTLRLMLRSFRRKMGETTMAPGTPRMMANGHMAGSSVDGMIAGHRGLESLLSMEGDGEMDFSILDDLGPFNWPENGFSPSNLPQWITEGVRLVGGRAVWKQRSDILPVNRTSWIWDCHMMGQTLSSYPLNWPICSFPRQQPGSWGTAQRRVLKPGSKPHLLVHLR